MQGVVLFERIYGYNKEVLYESRHYYPWPLLNNVGEFAHMEKDSSGLFKYHSGEHLQWIAQFVNGKINGFRKDFAVDRLIAECHYRDGVPDGIARFYFPHNGRLWREEEIAMGEVKHVKEYDLSGNLTIDETCFSPVQTACLTIEREKGLWPPSASAQPPFDGIDITLENGQVAYRDYKKGKLNGYSMVFSGLYDKINTIEYYVDGLKERVSLDFNKNGEWTCAHTYTSVKGGHGYYTSQDYSNGWQETSWLKGKENGVTRIYDAQGRLVKESEYKEGRLDGIAKKYFPSGHACSEEVYAHWELVSGKYFDEKGALKRGVRDAAKGRPKTCCRGAVPDDNGFFNSSQSFAYLGTITDIKEAKNFKTGSTHYVTLAISSTVLVPFRGTRQKGETAVFYYDYDWSEEQRMEVFPVMSFKKGDTYFLGLHTGIDGKLNFPGKSLESFMSFTVPADMVDELGKAKLDPDADRRLYEVIMRIVERHPPEGSWVFPGLFSKKFLEYLDASAKRVSFLELLVKTIVGRNVSGTSVQEAFKMLCLFSKDEQIALIEKISQQTQDPVIRGFLDGCTMELGLPKKLAFTDDAGEIEKYILMLGANAYENRQEARQFFIAMGHRATPYLSKAMFYKNDELRRQAAEVLKEIGDLQSVQVFLQGLEDPVLRYTAIQALGRLGDPRAVDALLRMLTNQDFHTRVYSAESLANFNDPRIPKALSSALVYALERDYAINVVSAAAEALGRSKCEQATDELLSLLDDPRAKKARNNLIKALGGRKSDKTFQALIPLLKDPDNYAKAMAAGALKDLNDPRALGPLCEALKTVSISDYNNNGDLAYDMILEAINAISGKKLSRGQEECPAGMISGF